MAALENPWPEKQAVVATNGKTAATRGAEFRLVLPSLSLSFFFFFNEIERKVGVGVPADDKDGLMAKNVRLMAISRLLMAAILSAINDL